MVEYVLKIDIDETDLVRKLKSAMKKAGALGLGAGGMIGGATRGTPKGTPMGKTMPQAMFPKEMPPMSMSNQQKLGFAMASARVKIDAFKEKSSFEMQNAMLKKATSRANALERIEKLQGDWKKRMFSAGTIVKLAGLATGVAGLLQFRKMVVDSSPMLQAMLKILNVGIMFILRPIGDMFGFIMRPLVIPFMQMAVQWYIKSLKMIPVWTKIGQSILAALHQQWGDSANLWHAAFVEWQGISEYERAISDSNKRIEAMMEAAKDEDSPGGEEITEKEQTGIDELILAEQEMNDEFNLHYKQLVAEIMSFVNSGDEWQKGQSELYGHLLDLDKIRNQRLQDEFEATQDMVGDLERVWAYLTGKGETLPKDKKYQLLGGDGEEHLLGGPKQPEEEEPTITKPIEPEIDQSTSAKYALSFLDFLSKGWNDFITWMESQSTQSRLRNVMTPQLLGYGLKTPEQIEADAFIGPRREEDMKESPTKGIPVGIRWLTDLLDVQKEEVQTKEEPLPPWVGSLQYIFGNLDTSLGKYTTAIQESNISLSKVRSARSKDEKGGYGEFGLTIMQQILTGIGNANVAKYAKEDRLEQQELERYPDKGDPNEIGREGLSILGVANYGKSQDQLTMEEKMKEQEALAQKTMEEWGYKPPTPNEEYEAKTGGYIKDVDKAMERFDELAVLREVLEATLTTAQEAEDKEAEKEAAEALRVLVEEQYRIINGIYETTGELKEVRNVLRTKLDQIATILTAGFRSQGACIPQVTGATSFSNSPYATQAEIDAITQKGMCCAPVEYGPDGRPIAPQSTKIKTKVTKDKEEEEKEDDSSDDSGSEGMAGGGVISEEIFGIGKCTGKKYRFGETGDEVVIPMNKFNTMVTNTSRIGIPSYITNPNIDKPQQKSKDYIDRVNRYNEDISASKDIQTDVQGRLEEYGEFEGEKTEEYKKKVWQYVCTHTRKVFQGGGGIGTRQTSEYKEFLAGQAGMLTELTSIQEQMAESQQKLDDITDRENVRTHDVSKFEGISGGRMAKYTRDVYEAQGAVTGAQTEVDEYGEFEGEKTETYKGKTWTYWCGLKRMHRRQGGGTKTRNTAEYNEWLSGQTELQTQLTNVQNMLDAQEEKIAPYADMFSSEQILQAMQGVMSTFETSMMGGGDQVTNKTTNQGDQIISTHNTEGSQTTSNHNTEGNTTTNLGGITINVNSSASNSDQLIVELGPKILKYLQDNDSRVGIR